MVLCNICRQDWFESLGKVQGWFATADSWVSLLQSDVWSMWQLTWNINSSEVSLSKYCDRNLASGIQWGALCVWHWGEASYLHPLSVSTTLQVPKNSERTSKCFLACQRHWNGSLRCSFRLGPLKFNICWLTASRTWNEWKHGCLRSSTPTMSEAAPPPSAPATGFVDHQVTVTFTMLPCQCHTQLWDPFNEKDEQERRVHCTSISNFQLCFLRFRSRSSAEFPDLTKTQISSFDKAQEYNMASSSFDSSLKPFQLVKPFDPTSRNVY